MLTVDTADFLIIVADGRRRVDRSSRSAGAGYSFRSSCSSWSSGSSSGRTSSGIAEPDSFITFFSNLGLGMLFFFAGYEIDFERIKGEPLKLAAIGWLISLALAYSIGGILLLLRSRAVAALRRARRWRRRRSGP